MKTCRNGHPNVAGGGYCLTCGAALGRVCSSGHVSDGEDGTCGVCGVTLGPLPEVAARSDVAATAPTPAPSEPSAPASAGAAPADLDLPPGVPRFIAPAMSPQPSSGDPAGWPLRPIIQAPAPRSGRWKWAVIGLMVAVVLMVVAMLLVPS